jgi:signal transduction histidine kinase
VSERQNRERELLAAVAKEQRRFGRDLHDGLGQELTGIALLIRTVSNRATKQAPALETTRAVARVVSAGLAGALLKVGGRGEGGTRVECIYEWPPAADVR